MSATNPQVWDCSECRQTYKSPIDLSTPPTHHCGGSTLSTKVKPFKLRQSAPQKQEVST